MPIPHMAFQYGMLMQLSIKLLVVLVLAATNSVATTRESAGGAGEENETAIALPGCKPKCGNVTIPYPFGIGADCYFGPRFEITCEDRSGPRLMKSRILVSNISLEEGELLTMQLVNRVCFDSQGDQTGTEDQSVSGLGVIPPYTVSGAKNMLVAVGCDTYVRLVGGRDDQNYTTGCISVCLNNISSNTIDKNDPCSGMGCCETKIPPLMHNLSLTVSSFRQHQRVWDFNPCSYAFVVQRGNFTFSNTSFQQLRNTTRFPLVLDWQIGDKSCRNACKGINSICQAKPSSGYICLCKPGYKGNPYLEDSCRDINECALSSTLCEHGKCANKVGNYTCVCDSGYKNQDAITCIKAPSAKKYLKISLSACLSFLVLLVGIFWTFRNMREKKFRSIRKKYFEDNGGLLFREKLASIPYAARTFTEEQLKEATRTYHVTRKVGEGGHGIVYKGILNEQLVAIKKPKPSPPNTETEPSSQEMIVLSQINHKNVVRLVGCCLETRTPTLVYEFIAKGTLYEHIHEKQTPLSLELRLQIASEAADALAYLHHSTSTSIIHGDVKTASILLHENFTAKVTNFGASRLVPKDEDPLLSLCQRTSDVYSFGVVLAELLTSRKPVSSEKLEEESNLAKFLAEILDQEMVEGHFETAKLAADLAIRCLRVKGEERPSMKEVAAELEGLVRTMEQHPSGGEANITPSLKDTGNLVGASAST
ncbi:unnamed protein product [Prunus armeniaca]